MDIAKAFTFVIEDENWMMKLGLGALVALASFLIIPIPLLLGYSVAVTRNVMNGASQPLPDWDNWSEFFRDGLNLIGAQLIYTSPLLILVCIATFSTVGFGTLLETNEDIAAAGFFATFGLLFCVGALFGLGLAFISPAIYVQYVRHNSLAACLRFGEVIGIVRENIGDIVLIVLAIFGVSMVFSVVTGGLAFIPCLGQIATLVLSLAFSPYMAAVSGHLYGQLASKSMGSKFA